MPTGSEAALPTPINVALSCALRWSESFGLLFVGQWAKSYLLRRWAAVRPVVRAPIG